MVHSKRLNVQKFNLGGTPRKVLYHSESRLLLVMRTELANVTSSSDICCVDPLSGTVLSSFKLEQGETGKSMELVRAGNEQVLVVGTNLSFGPAIMPSGEAERCTIFPVPFIIYLSTYLLFLSCCIVEMLRHLDIQSLATLLCEVNILVVFYVKRWQDFYHNLHAYVF